jgi:hypothetical protein
VAVELHVLPAQCPGLLGAEPGQLPMTLRIGSSMFWLILIVLTERPTSQSSAAWRTV